MGTTCKHGELEADSLPACCARDLLARAAPSFIINPRSIFHFNRLANELDNVSGQSSISICRCRPIASHSTNRTAKRRIQWSNWKLVKSSDCTVSCQFWPQFPHDVTGKATINQNQPTERCSSFTANSCTLESIIRVQKRKVNTSDARYRKAQNVFCCSNLLTFVHLHSDKSLRRGKSFKEKEPEEEVQIWAMNFSSHWNQRSENFSFLLIELLESQQNFSRSLFTTREVSWKSSGEEFKENFFASLMNHEELLSWAGWSVLR